jgi:flagellar biosynthesis protein FlhB
MINLETIITKIVIVLLYCFIFFGGFFSVAAIKNFTIKKNKYKSMHKEERVKLFALLGVGILLAILFVFSIYIVFTYDIRLIYLLY